MATQQLGFSTSEFWSMTLRDYDVALQVRIRTIRRVYDTPAALICSILAEINRDREARPEPFTIDDFLPKEDGPVKPDPEDELARSARMLEKLKMLTLSLGGEIIDHTAKE